MYCKEWFYGEAVDSEVAHQRVFQWRVILEAIALGVALAFLLPGCTTTPLPLCEQYKYEFVQDEDGRVLLAIDAENVKKLGAIIRGIQNCTCRVSMGTEV